VAALWSCSISRNRGVGDGRGTQPPRFAPRRAAPRESAAPRAEGEPAPQRRQKTPRVFRAAAMLPLSLLRTATGHPMLVELKNGETYNGHLVSCDNWMNISLREVICTSRDGDRFWRLPEVVIRGNNIKYLRIPEEVIDMVPEEDPSTLKGGRGGGRGGDRGGGRGGRGRGEGRGGGRGRGGRSDGRGAGRAAGRGSY